MLDSGAVRACYTTERIFVKKADECFDSHTHPMMLVYKLQTPIATAQCLRNLHARRMPIMFFGIIPADLSASRLILKMQPIRSSFMTTSPKAISNRMDLSNVTRNALLGSSILSTSTPREARTLAGNFRVLRWCCACSSSATAAKTMQCPYLDLLRFSFLVVGTSSSLLFRGLRLRR